MEPVQTPSPEHIRFEELCAEVDDFEPLPTISSGALEAEQEVVEDTPLDQQILAGLVSPV